jgi:nucleotide-binding universal stress UspA family protein
VEATYVNDSGNVRPIIMKTAQEYNCDLLIMGGYGRKPWLEILFESLVDQILRIRQFPVLICR